VLEQEAPEILVRMNNSGEQPKDHDEFNYSVMPKRTRSMSGAKLHIYDYLLKNGKTHYKELAQAIDTTVSSVSGTLSKNKDLFSSVPGEKGFWNLTQ